MDRTKKFRKEKICLTDCCSFCIHSDAEKQFLDKTQTHLVKLPVWVRSHLDSTFCKKLQEDVQIFYTCKNFKRSSEDSYKKYTVNEIRDLIEEYFYLRCNEEIANDEGYGDPDEAGQIEFNMFLKWLGVREPIGDKLGWENLSRKWVGKRRKDKKEVKREAKRLIKTMNPEKLFK